MNKKRLILKNRHWRYTVGSVILLLPLLLTVIAVGGVWLTNNNISGRALQFLLERRFIVLAGMWFVLPLLSIYLAHASYQRGTIDRWRPINKITKLTGIICLLIISGLAVLG